MFLQMKQQLGLLQCRAPEGRPESTTASSVKGQNWIKGYSLLSTEQFDQEAVQSVAWAEAGPDLSVLPLMAFHFSFGFREHQQGRNGFLQCGLVMADRQRGLVFSSEGNLIKLSDARFM